jgi:hypothetical protein
MNRRRILRRALELKFEDSAGYWKTLREKRADKKGRVVVRKNKLEPTVSQVIYNRNYASRRRRKKFLFPYSIILSTSLFLCFSQ